MLLAKEFDVAYACATKSGEPSGKKRRGGGGDLRSFELSFPLTAPSVPYAWFERVVFTFAFEAVEGGRVGDGAGVERAVLAGELAAE